MGTAKIERRRPGATSGGTTTVGRLGVGWRQDRALTDELVRRARSGDEEAFASLVVANVRRLEGLARLILGEPSAAEEAVQDAFLHAWRHLDGLRDPGRFDPWMRRLTVNAAYDIARRRPPRLRAIDPAERADADPADRVAARDELGSAFRRLSTEHRAVLALRYHLDLSVAAISEAIGAPEGTVRSRLHYALRALRAELEAGGRVSTDGRPQRNTQR